MAYQAKPIVVDAIQYTGVIQDLIDFGATARTLGNDEVQCAVTTNNGEVLCANGDYVTKDQILRFNVVRETNFPLLFDAI